MLCDQGRTCQPINLHPASPSLLTRALLDFVSCFDEQIPQDLFRLLSPCYWTAWWSLISSEIAVLVCALCLLCCSFWPLDSVKAQLCAHSAYHWNYYIKNWISPSFVASSPLEIQLRCKPLFLIFLLVLQRFFVKTTMFSREKIYCLFQLSFWELFNLQ